MKIHGNRVYLDLPDMPEYKTSVPDHVRKELQQELLKKMDRLKVFAVGEGVKLNNNSAVSVNVIDINTGDEVFVDPHELQRGVIFEIDGKRKISISSFGIMHTW